MVRRMAHLGGLTQDHVQGIGPASTAGRLRHTLPTPVKDKPMTWQTPTATDMRFGFEITMYVSAR
jgi:coenzyme PQQ precursor peptide PqqA